MNAGDIKRLAQLWQFREVRALHALEKQRLAMSAAQDALQKQQQLVDDLKARLEEAALRNSSSTVMSAATLQEDSLYRRMLRLDIGRERYYQSVAVDDVRQERRKLNKCRSVWAREYGRLDTVPAMEAEERGRNARVQLRKESNQMDDLFDRPPSLLGKEHA